MAGFGYIPVCAEVLLDDEMFRRIIADSVNALEAVGGQPCTRDALPTTGPIFYLVATGGTEKVLLEILDERAKTVAGEPVFLIAHPSNNSLPACLEVLARIRQDGRRGRIFYLRGPDDEGGSKAIAEAADDLRVFHALKATRVGLIGEPSDWLVASSPDLGVLRELWGPTVVEIGMQELADTLGTIPSGLVDTTVESVAGGAGEIREPSTAEQQDAVRVHESLKALVKRHELDALTLRCFDLVLEQRTTGCFALARLNDVGVIAGCEGDLASTLGMLWAHELLGKIPWMANPARLDEGRNTLWLAHCTVPLSLVHGYRLRSHFESGLGVAIQGTLPGGPATLLRIGGADMKDLWLAEGEILQSGSSESLCRTQAEIRLTRGRVHDLLTSPLGNHLVMASGHHADRLRQWHETIL